MKGEPMNHPDKSGTDDFPITVEGLGISIFLGLLTIEDAEVTASVDHEAHHPGDRDTPESGGASWIYDFTVDSVGVSFFGGRKLLGRWCWFNTRAKWITRRAWKYLFITWAWRQDDWATKVWNERAGAEYEAAEEAKADAARERRLE